MHAKPTPQGAPAPTPADPLVTQANPLVTQADGQKFLGISRTTLYFLRKNGSLPEVKIGSAVRFRMSDLQKIAASGAKTSAPTPAPATPAPATPAPAPTPARRGRPRKAAPSITLSGSAK